jgi:predicted acetyltransferase
VGGAENQMNLSLVRPSEKLGQQFMEMADEFRLAGEAEYLDEDAIAKGLNEYLKWLSSGEVAENLPPNLVPWSAFWAVSDGQLIGLSSLRHTLSPWMAEFGGHIGYRVRPQARRSGVGTLILRSTLEKAFQRGTHPVLIVCTPENTASVAVIKKNGGIFDREVEREDGVRLHRFWISKSAASK